VKRKHGQEQQPNEHKELLLKAVRLWFTIRMYCLFIHDGSAYTSSQDTA
jgi:hypothetical protein